jgi:predicted CXXCH cytochrome family protein
MCVACHTPHNGSTTVAEAPLWNHELTAATFSLYSTSTLDATDMGQPDGISKLCLSCHDGTIALEDFGGTTTGTNFIAGADSVGIDLSNDHPVSFTYNTALATTDGQLHDPSTALSGLGSTIAADMLFTNKLECASCHDVHNDGNLTSMLLISNAGSDLCMTCHNK